MHIVSFQGIAIIPRDGSTILENLSANPATWAHLENNASHEYTMEQVLSPYIPNRDARSSEWHRVILWS